MENDCIAHAPQTYPSSDELLRLVVESATDYAIIAQDPRGKVISWNSGAERLLGYTREEILGHSADIIFTPEDRAAVVERSQAGAQGRAERPDAGWGAQFHRSGRSV